MFTVPPPLATVSRRLGDASRTLARWPKKYTIPATGIVLSGILYGLVFVPSTVIAVDYSQTSQCANQLTLLPQLHQSSSSSLQLQPTAIWQINGFQIASSQTCLIIASAPQAGNHSAELSMMGMNWLARQYRIEVPNYPTVSVGPLQHPVAITKPLVLELTQTDLVFSYQLQVDHQVQECQAKNNQLFCPINQFELQSGQSYEITLRRLFNGQQIDVLAQTSIQTLSPVKITAASVDNNALVYGQLKSIVLNTDKPIAKAQAVLHNQTAKQQIATQQSITDSQLAISWDQDLPLRTSFELAVDYLEATDSSSLVEVYKLSFSTAGGPKVVSINIGSAGVALDSTVVVSFDQELDAGQDVASHISIKPGRVTTSVSGSKISLKLAGLEPCAEFTITIDDQIKNPTGTSGDSAKTHTSRTICRTTQTIGYSVKGRPIIAHTFGSGSTAILYTANIHGNEVGTKYLMDLWMKELESKSSQIPAGRKIVVVPLVNPDGYAAGTRNNANNVDLNRNFATADWKKDVPDTSGKMVVGGGGASPMDQPETIAIANLTSQLKPRTTMQYHNVGSMVESNQAAHANALAQIYTGLSGYQNITGNSNAFGYAITGTYEGWMAEKLGLASIVIELGSRSDPQWSRNSAAMWRVATY